MRILQLRGIGTGLENVVVNIDRSTHIGRAGATPSLTPRNFQEATGRPLPAEFHDAEICFQLDSQEVSRNHALIRRYSRLGGLLIGYEVIDLNSKNGTGVNGKKKQRSDLEPGMRVTFGDIEFEVRYKESSGLNYALLVGSDGGHLRGVSTDIVKMQDFWRKRKGFTTENITALINGFATYDRVLERLEEAKRSCSDESLFVFHFSGHGRRGVYLSDRRLNPATLYGHLNHVRGRKIVIVDACHAGDFAEEELPEKTLLMLACQKEERAYEDYHETLMNPDYMGNFTRALLRILENKPNCVNLKEIERELQGDFRLYHKGQNPKVTGYTIICPSLKTEFRN